MPKGGSEVAAVVAQGNTFQIAIVQRERDKGQQPLSSFILGSVGLAVAASGATMGHLQPKEV